MPPARKAPLLVIFLTVFVDLLGFGMVLPLLPIYATQFTVDESGWTIGLLMSSFSAMQFFFAPVWGRISDRVGRRAVLMIGLAGSVVFYFLFGIAAVQKSLVLLFVSRIGAGLCGATIGTAQAYIADVTAPEARARGMALIGAAFGLGFTFGPLIGAAALFSTGGGDEQIGTSPWPGYVAAMLSGVALLMAIFWLPESLRRDREHTARKLLDVHALGVALRTPSIAPLFLTSFVTVLSFANFESTLALLLKVERGGFEYAFYEVLLVFAFVGFVLTVAQGFLVRRLSGRLPEGVLASAGAVISIVGFLLLVWVSGQPEEEKSLPLLLIALAVEVTGFAFMPPSIQSLISRRSDPSQQGGILGVGQSISSLARILGPVIGIRLFHVTATMPFWAAAALMVLGLVLVIAAAPGGRDFASGEQGITK